MRILLALSHSIEEHDQLELLSSLGYEVSSLGGYIDPAHPHDDKRPALPDVPCVEEVREAVDEAGGMQAAQERIPDRVLEWLGDDGAIVFHHHLHRLFSQWDRVGSWRRGGSGRRVVWRTVGQSVENNEREAAPFREDGLEVVRYSPRERAIPSYCGEDALIRFAKDPDEWGGWVGDERHVVQVSQDARRRDPWTNYGYWAAATSGLPAQLVGSGSDAEGIGGAGVLGYDEMRQALRRARCYLYTGTQPASYTLGFVEAAMTGVPIVSIGRKWMTIFPYGPELFEAYELATAGFDNPRDARDYLHWLLEDWSAARKASEDIRARTVDLFGSERIGAQWAAFLGAP